MALTYWLSGAFTIVLVTATAVSAQPREVPRIEIGAYVASWNIWDDDGGGAGARVSHNYRQWFAVEYASDFRPAPYGGQGDWVTGANTKIAVFRQRTPFREQQLFVTVGLMAGHGLDWRYTPTLGGGAQFTWPARRRTGFRVELQKFARVRGEDSIRLLFGFSVGTS